MLAGKRAILLNLFQDQLDGSTTALARNRHNYSTFNLDDNDVSYDIPLDYQNYTEISSGASQSAIPTTQSNSGSSTYVNPDISEWVEVMNEHINDRYIHITTDERAKWNTQPAVESEKLLLF